MRLARAFGLLGALLWIGCSDAPDSGERQGSDPGGCPKSLVDCSGTCVDSRVDPAHCGGCNLACEDGRACLEGACVALRCEEGLAVCGNGCVDFAADASHCGGCGIACVEGQDCVDGRCACPEGASLCEDVCVDTRSDGEHCGGCGNECSAGTICRQGSCVLPACEGALLLPGPAELEWGGPALQAALADWNGDGYLDLLVALAEPPELRVFGNRGDGTFVPQGAAPGIPAGPFVAADLDGDGDVDLAVVDPAQPDRPVLALRGAGGGFELATLAPASGPIAELVAVELEGGVPPRLAAVAGRELRIYRTDGTGSWAVELPGDGAARSVRAGALGGGRTGLVATGDAGAWLVGLTVAGDAIEAEVLALPELAIEVELADLDGDGHGDLVGANGVVLRNDGQDRFAPVEAALPSGSAVEVADLNGDGRPDLVFAVEGDLLPYLAGPEGFAPAKPAFLPPGASWLAAADLDGDGIPDLLAADLDRGRAALLPGRGDGTFPARSRITAHAGEGPRLGLAQVVAGSAAEVFLGFRNEPVLQIYRFSSWGLQFAADWDVGHGVEDFALGDVDGDGWADLATLDRERSRVNLALSRPREGFAAPIPLEVGEDPVRVLLVDVDRDGWRDLAVLEAGSRTIRVLRNHAWTEPTVLSFSEAPHDLAVGDVDGDGIADFVVALPDRVVALRGDGRGGFSSPAEAEVAARSLVLGDLDGDGTAEIVAVGADAVRVLRRVEGGLLVAASHAVAGGVAAAPGDLDLDGRRDLVVLAEDGRIHLLRNAGFGELAPGGSWPALSTAFVPGAAALVLADGNRDGWVEPVVAGEAELGWLFPRCREP